MIDKFGRSVDYLRVSVSDKCNMTCEYCHSEGNCSPKEELTPAKLRRIMSSAKNIGIDKVKITGGEPLLRKDIEEIIKIISETSGIKEVSMTTNGSLLEKKARALKEAGLDRVNIGCDSVDLGMQKNTKVTKKAIDAARRAGLGPIKINMVVLKGINDDQVEKMIDFARQNDVTLQLIELINMTVTPDYYSKHHVNLSDWEEKLSGMATKVVKRRMQSRMKYIIDGATVEVIRPDKGDFCRHCNKIRISADGKIKPCLRMPIFVNFEDDGSFSEAIKQRVIYNEDS